MARRDCPIKLNECAGSDSPVLNLSAEASDPLMFAGVGWPTFNPFKPPPLGNGPYTEEDCLNITWSAVSQALADFLSQINAAACQPPTPPGGTPTWPEYPPFPPFDWQPPSWTPDPETTVTCFNDRQFASLTCPDGSIFTAEIPAGTVTATLPPALCQAWVQYINAWILAGLLQQLYAAQVCATVPGLTDRTPPGVHPTPPPGPNAPPPKFIDYPGWCCLGESPIENQCLYNLGDAPAGSTWDFAVTAGALPPGITLVQTSPTSAVLTGTTTVAGNFDYAITATRTDISGTSVTITDTFNILGLSNASLPDGVLNNAYSEQLSGAGGYGTYTFTLIGTLPVGLSMDGDGLITGTPTVPGAYSFQVEVTDTTTGGHCTIDVSLEISDCDWTIIPETLAPEIIGNAYDQTLTVDTGGTGPYTFAVVVGSLPNNIVMDANGHFTGTPDTAGTSTFTVRVTDSLLATCDRTYSITVSPVADFLSTLVWAHTGPGGTYDCDGGSQGIVTSTLAGASGVLTCTNVGGGGPCPNGYPTFDTWKTIGNNNTGLTKTVRVNIILTYSGGFGSRGGHFNGDPFYPGNKWENHQINVTKTGPTNITYDYTVLPGTFRIELACLAGDDADPGTYAAIQLTMTIL